MFLQLTAASDINSLIFSCPDLSNSLLMTNNYITWHVSIIN